MRSTSGSQPRISGTRWCSALGHDIENRSAPGEAAPPGLLDRAWPWDWPRRAGAAARAWPASLVSRGYMNTPPRIRMRCISATSEAIQRMLKSLPRRPAVARQALVDIAPHRRLPEPLVGGVDGELAVSSGMRMFGWVSMNSPNLAVEREAVDAAPEGQHQHGGRPVDRIAGAHLRACPAAGSPPAAGSRTPSGAPAARRRCCRRAR